MEVVLKKSKITLSILKQAVQSSIVDIKVADPLGWVIYNKRKFIVAYRSDLNSLSVYPMFERIDVKEFADRSGKHSASVHLGGNYVPHTYELPTKSETEIFVEAFERFKNNAKSKGQFFI